MDSFYSVFYTAPNLLLKTKIFPLRADARTEDGLQRGENMSAIQFLKTSLPQTERQIRRNARCSVILPLRLTTGSGEMIPAVILNVSSSGLLLVVDERSSLTLPLPRGAYVDGEFFFDELEVPDITLEIVRIERRNKHQLALGCKFVDLAAHVAAEIHAKINARLSSSPHKS